jgi:hypothetical protein
MINVTSPRALCLISILPLLFGLDISWDMQNSLHAYSVLNVRFAMWMEAMSQALIITQIMMTASTLMCLLLFIQLGRSHPLTPLSPSTDNTSASSENTNAD